MPNDRPINERHEDERHAFDELISRYGLDEDLEYIIIPFTGSDGRKKRCFVLKRKYLRIVYPDKHVADFPIGKIVEAIVEYPELPVTEALALLHHEEPHIQEPEGSPPDKETDI